MKQVNHQPYSLAATTNPLGTQPVRHIRRVAWLACCTLAAGLVVSNTVDARDRDPLVGPYPYDFPARASLQGSLILQEAKRRNGGGSGSGNSGASAGGINAGAIINNNSTAISVGNWQQIEMTLGDGAEGLIMTENHQTNQAEASALSRVGATLNMEQGESGSVIEQSERSK